MEKAIKEAELSNPKIIKVAVKLVNEAKFQIARSKEFLKHQLAHLQVLSRAHSEKLKKKAELRKKRNNDPRNFKVHKEFKFSDFGISEWDRLGAILPNKSNKCVGEMMTSLNPSLPRRKRKAMELEPETYIVGLHCKRELPTRV
ncbi:hypothetical protein Tco_0968095 [Tanacetum coccineum]